MTGLIKSNGKKPNNSANAEGLSARMALHRERERMAEKLPLRINANTVIYGHNMIYVNKEKCNEQYAEEYRQRIKRFSLHD